MFVRQTEKTNFWLQDVQMVKWLRKITRASMFHFPVFRSMSPHLHVHVSKSMSPCLHFSMFPCLYVSMSLCFHVSISMFPLSPWFRDSVNGTQNWWKMATSVCLLQTDNRNSKLPRLFAANRNGKRKFVFIARQTINGKWRLLFQQTCPSMREKNTFFPTVAYQQPGITLIHDFFSLCPPWINIIIITSAAFSLISF